MQPSIFVAQPIAAIVVFWQNDPELKARFAIELAKGNRNPFECAVEVFGKDTNKALWASANWLNDPEVIKAKQNYTEAISPAKTLLDKEQLSAKLLSFSEEKITFNGNEVYAAEAKDRLAALKLYAEVQGFINNKTEINNNIQNNNKFMEIKFVEPEKKEDVKIINAIPVEENELIDNLPVELKLVG